MSRLFLFFALSTAIALAPHSLLAQSEKADTTEATPATSGDEASPRADEIAKDETAMQKAESDEAGDTAADDKAAGDEQAKAEKEKAEKEVMEFDHSPPPPLTEAQRADWHARAKKAKEEEKRKAEEIAKEPLPLPTYDCGDGLVFDDGTVETGYSFVPSAKWGMYLQQYNSADLPSRKIESVCVCWLRTRDDRAIDFEVVFVESQGPVPAAEPYAVQKASVDLVPRGVERAGHFYPVRIKDVEIPEGTSYIGVRWNPSVDKFFFLCSNKSESTKVIPGFQREDRAKGWDDVLNTRDYIFDDHRSMMLRVTAEKPPKPSSDAEGASGASQR